MRHAVILALLILLAGAIWVVSAGRTDPIAPDSPEQEQTTPTEEELRLRERLGRKTGTLAIRAQTSDGEVPVGLEVGYVRADGTTRWNYAIEGEKLFTDAPLGMLTTVARAQGYPAVQQECQVIAGVPSSCVVLLKPTPEEPEQGSRDE